MKNFIADEDINIYISVKSVQKIIDNDFGDFSEDFKKAIQKLWEKENGIYYNGEIKNANS